MMPPSEQITVWLARWGEGDQHARDQVFGVVHSRLREIAAHLLQRERGDHTLEPNALVNELCIRLFGNQKINYNDRAHFFAVVAQTMRRILIDHARAGLAEKRGGDQQRVSLSGVDGWIPVPLNEDMLALDAALSKLAALDPRAAQVVELRFFGGLEEDQVAEVLGVSAITVKRDWKAARAWLAGQLSPLIALRGFDTLRSSLPLIPVGGNQKMRIFLSIAVGAIWCMRPVICPAQTSVSDRFYQAIRNDNAEDLRALVESQDVNAKDSRGATPLMYTAAFGNAGQMKLLLESGADVNARNAFHATALIWAGGDAVKSRMLIEHGADVNIRTQQGRIPLMVAAKRNGNAGLVRLLLEKGADIKTTGDTTLIAAAQSGDVEIMQLLIESGANVNCIAPRLGETPLHYAAASGSVKAVRLLLAKGANPNAALKNVTAVRGGSILDSGISKQTPLMWAGPTGSPEIIRALVDAGANVNAQDIRGMSPLMLAVASENQDLAVVRVLLQSGANVNTRSGLGETALDWARKFGSRPVIAALQNAGASEGVRYQAPPAPDRSTTRDTVKAVEQSIVLLQRSSAEFFKQSGCVGCHHQDVTAFAVRAARTAGIPLDEAVARERLNVMKSSLGSQQELLLQGVLNDINVQANHLGGLWASGHSSDIVTDAAIASLVPGQYPDGHWQRYAGAVRSPTGESPIVWTAEAVLALQRYSIPARAAELRERVERASAWLQKAKPRNTYQHALQLLALSAAGAEKDKVKHVADSLLAQQRSDGGWAGNPNLASDAHSTGLALHALREAGFLSVTGLAHRRGVQYLLSTQYPDGSWYVRSRAAGFQPYFESGFPFKHDQWISAAATAWAAEALARSIESQVAAGLR